MKNKSITNREDDFAQWYTDVVMSAKLADYSSVKGCVIFEPNGNAIWEKMKEVLDKMFKETGHENVYMPVLIPESLLKKEGDLIEGFAPECAWVTQGGNSDLEEKLAFRPTSETLFSDYYSKKIKSYRDLPKLYNQWANVIRWEKETRPFLRTREFLWQEGHTVHETEQEAIDETIKMLNVYKKFFVDYLAIPVITGKKTEKEKFAGAESTYTIEALMYNGVALQSATSHYFGQKFAKAYDIKFLSRDEKWEYAYQTSWGATTRMIGALIMVHSDNKGLVLPPKIAPKQVVIIPIGKDEIVSELASTYSNILNKAGIVTYIDKTERSPGFKFAEAEVNGIPIRIEIGVRDLETNKITIARRDTGEKIQIDKGCDLENVIKDILEKIQNNLLQKATERRDELTFECKNINEVEKQINSQPGFIKAEWCGCLDCELKMKEYRGIKSRCILEDPIKNGKCVVCGMPSKFTVMWGIQY